MYKNVQTSPKKFQNWTQHSCCSMLTLKKIESNKRQRISFRPQRWHVPYWNHQACRERCCFVRSLYPNLPQIGQRIYHGMLMPLHYSMNNRQLSWTRKYNNHFIIASRAYFQHSSAYKLVEISNRCPWVHGKVPCNKWEWISNTRAPLIAGKTLRCLVFKF